MSGDDRHYGNYNANSMRLLQEEYKLAQEIREIERKRKQEKEENYEKYKHLSSDELMEKFFEKGSFEKNLNRKLDHVYYGLHRHYPREKANKLFTEFELKKKSEISAGSTVKLIKVMKSDKADKKYVAIFSTGKKTYFGSAGMDDYTLTRNALQRQHYQARHEKDLQTNDPTRAGYLAYHILWGPTTSVQSNVSLYKKKFNL